MFGKVHVKYFGAFEFDNFGNARFPIEEVDNLSDMIQMKNYCILIGNHRIQIENYRIQILNHRTHMNNLECDWGKKHAIQRNIIQPKSEISRLQWKIMQFK